MADGASRHDQFTFEQPRPVGRLRSFTRRSHYRAVSGLTSAKNQLGSNSSLNSSLSGSTQNLLDPVKMMSMQEDAHTRRISSEVLKRCISSYSSSPYHRRQSMHPGDCRRARPPSMHGDSLADSGHTIVPVSSRWAQSLPVSPAQSHITSPVHSPTLLRRFNAFSSHGPTPRNSTPDGTDYGSTTTLDVEEDSWKGLASLFKPRPRYIPAAPVNDMSQSLDESMELSFDGSRTSCELSATSQSYHSSVASPL